MEDAMLPRMLSETGAEAEPVKTVESGLRSPVDTNDCGHHLKVKPRHGFGLFCLLHLKSSVSKQLSLLCHVNWMRQILKLAEALFLMLGSAENCL